MWDEFQSMKDEPTRKCPKCRKLKAERMISAGGGLLFKGSGFYLTDYRSESYKKGEAAAKGSSESRSDSGSKSESPAKSESSKPSKSE